MAGRRAFLVAQTTGLPHHSAHRTVLHMRFRIAQFGLGPIGLETIKRVATKPWARVVGGVDHDPTKAGADLGKLTGLKLLNGKKIYRSLSELLECQKPDLVFHTSVSRFAAAFEQLEPMARLGINVVSSCEEMLFPALREPRLSAKLDRICRNNGSRMVATGVNPGFVMDVLALCLTGVSSKIDAIQIRRVVNASTRREPLQRKIGSGWTTTEFHRRFSQGTAGHAGLKESLALIAHCLGWPLQQIRETGKAMVADHDIRTRHLEVKRGQTCGLHQRAEAKVAGKVRLTLDLKMYLDAEMPHDAIQIEGEPPLQLVLEGGVAGDLATVAALINTAPRLMKASPGLRLMSELPLPHMARGGSPN